MIILGICFSSFTCFSGKFDQGRVRDDFVSIDLSNLNAQLRMRAPAACHVENKLSVIEMETSELSPCGDGSFLLDLLC